MEQLSNVGTFTRGTRDIINRNFALLGAGGGSFGGHNLYVDGDLGYDDSAKVDGGWSKAYATIQAAIDDAEPGDDIWIRPLAMAAGATDPESYAETLTIAADQCGLRLHGVGAGLAQGALPQIKKGSGSTALLTVRAPGCLIEGLGFNGASATGGGILLDDDGSTKSAFGTIIAGCHFKNCKGSTATSSATGGAIQWSAQGGAWQTRIVGNQFYKNVGGIVLLGTGGSVPQDVVIADNYFTGTAATVDSYIYFGGSGMANVLIHHNVFASVLPALSSGAVVRYVSLIGTGIFSDNYFASTDTTTGFGAARASAIIPATIGIVHCYSDGGLIVRQ